jgi:transposase
LIVEETLEAGSSVARVALKHGVNANQVFKWRRLHEAGRLGTQRYVKYSCCRFV